MNSTKVHSKFFNADFASKVRWRMRYDRNPLLSIFQDKYSVRKYAKSKGINAAHLIYSTDDPNSIPWNDIPANCFIKANHGCEWNILRFDSHLYLFQDGSDFENISNPFFDFGLIEKYKISKSKCISLCQEWLRTKYQSEEWAYQNIEPRILIEEIQLPKNGEDLFDYRFYTFNGKVKTISIGSLNYRKTKKNIFLDTNWNEIRLSKYKEEVPKPIPSKPANLPEMISIAENLGDSIDFVRVDLYNTNKGIILSEMTVYPEGGAQCTPTLCPTFNKWLGSHWQLPIRKSIQAYFFNVIYSSSIKIFGRYRNWRINPTKAEILNSVKLCSEKEPNLKLSDKVYT